MEWRLKNVVVVSVANPAAGANFVFTQPAFRQGIAARRLVGVMLRIVADANVANRQLHIAVDDGAVDSARFTSPLVQGAGETRNTHFARGVAGVNPPISNTEGNLAPLGDAWVLAAAWRVVSQVVNIQVGDQISNVRLTFEEWG